MEYLGDLDAARRYARQRAELPFFREAAHLAVPWLLTTAALAGDFHDAVELAERFRVAWAEAGRPTIGGLGFAPAAAAMVYGIRGDDEARREWLGILTEMRRVVRRWADTNRLHAGLRGARGAAPGELGDALTHLAAAPESFKRWYDGAWRQWYAAVWAEAAVLGERADRHERLQRARFVTAHNPIASAMVDRAEALAAGDTDRLLAAAAILDTAGSTYQRARTLVLAGGDARVEGEAILAAIGAAPMAM